MQQGAGVLLWAKDETTGEWMPLERDASGRLKVATTYGKHHAHHEDGGDDEISVAGLSGVLADNQPFAAHDLGGAKHTADTLANLNALITDATLDDVGDPRDPNAHAASHQNGGGDEIDVAGLSGVLADKQDADKLQGRAVQDHDPLDGEVLTWVDAQSRWEPKAPPAAGAHAATHEDGGADEISVAGLSGVLADKQYPDIGISNWGIIHDFTNWVETKTGSGATYREFFRGGVHTGTTAASTARIHIYNQYTRPWAKDIDFSCYLMIVLLSIATPEGWVKIGKDNTIGDSTESSVGFRIAPGPHIYGFVYDTSLHEVDLGVVTADWHHFRVKVTNGVGTEWFIDGVSEGSCAYYTVATGVTYVHLSIDAGATPIMDNMIEALRTAYDIEW